MRRLRAAVWARQCAGRCATAACAVAIGLAASEGAAAAQLRASIDRLAETWRAVGASVAVDKTRFLNDDETIVVALPDLPEGDCTTVVLLGARGLGFHARPAEGPDAPGARVPSEAGALSIERCGEAMPHRLLVTSDSGRGALETIVARSAKPLEPMRSVLPERTGAAIDAAPEPGVLPPMAAAEKRADVAEARARRDGAAVAPRATWPAGADGGGSAEDTLDAGCHTLQLFAVDPRSARHGSRAKLDLDAEMRDATGDRILARDRTDAPDARLDLCVGELTKVSVAFVGSPPDESVLVAHVAWPLPDRLPTLWGSEARARMAHVLLTRHVHELLREPILLAQGGSGTTPVPLTIEPGGCYLALVAIVQGATRSVGLRVHVGARDAFDDRGVDENGAVVAFCSGDRTGALAEVDARGTPLLGWGMALYRVGSGEWEVPQ
jgi:hypothetical protein